RSGPPRGGGPQGGPGPRRQGAGTRGSPPWPGRAARSSGLLSGGDEGQLPGQDGDGDGVLEVGLDREGVTRCRGGVPDPPAALPPPGAPPRPPAGAPPRPRPRAPPRRPPPPPR